MLLLLFIFGKFVVHYIAVSDKITRQWIFYVIISIGRKLVDEKMSHFKEDLLNQKIFYNRSTNNAAFCALR